MAEILKVHNLRKILSIYFTLNLVYIFPNKTKNGFSKRSIL